VLRVTMRRARRALPLVLLVFALSPAYASAADSVSLRAGPNPVRYAGKVALSGTITPAVAGETVSIYTQTGVSVGTVITNTDGTFSRPATIKTHAVFFARVADAAGNPVDSAPVSVVVRPRFAVSRIGSQRIGSPLVLVGRVLPRVAGTVLLKEGKRSRRVRVRPNGRFRTPLTTTRLYRYRADIRLRPATGYLARHRTFSVRVKLRPLAIGSRGPAVNWLEYSLRHLHHFALPRVNSVYDYATADAVLAFQKVHGLPRTGSVSRRFWQVLRRSGVPRARVPSGNHIEVDKTRQVLFEVWNGEVVSVSHVSTGATGNTPVGRWRVYSKGLGFNGSGMYDSLFFVGAFAIHGYHSVPSYPASHGCVRTPFWFARQIYSNWRVGTSVYVFP
jgi:hypothetical protein